MRLQLNNNGQYTVTLPKSLVLAKGWVKGQELTVKVDDKGRLILG